MTKLSDLHRLVPGQSGGVCRAPIFDIHATLTAKALKYNNFGYWVGVDPKAAPTTRNALLHKGLTILEQFFCAFRRSASRRWCLGFPTGSQGLAACVCDISCDIF